MLCVCVLVVAVVKGIGKVTQTPGINGRVQTNLEFVLLDRIVWPNMAANYDMFPEEIRKVISREEAEIFDSHNNNVMYRLAPMVQEACGEEKAREMYYAMGILLTLYSAIIKRMRNRLCFFRMLIPYLGMGIILTLWFSLGDGAPPNDRYALLIYLFWSLVTVGCLGFWDSESISTIED